MFETYKKDEIVSCVALNLWIVYGFEEFQAVWQNLSHNTSDKENVLRASQIFSRLIKKVFLKFNPLKPFEEFRNVFAQLYVHLFFNSVLIEIFLGIL